MQWSWKIARIANIDVYIHTTFFLLLAWFAYSDWKQAGTIEAVIQGSVFIILLFTCVVLHEFGHALTARRYKVVTNRITLLPIGGVASMERIPDDPKQELHIAVAGPMVNVVIAGLLYFWMNLSDISITEEDILSNNLPLAYRLLLVNVMLVVFNMLPVYPTDGGRVLRALLAMRMPHHKATAIAARIGQTLAIVMGIVGFLYNHPMLILIAVFLWFGATAENQMEQTKVSLHNITAEQAMITEFHILSPNAPLSLAVQYTLSSNQKNFPVGNEHQLEGVLTQNQLMLALQKFGETAQVHQAMINPIQTVAHNTPVENILADIQMKSSGIVAVSKSGQIVGIIDLDNIIELIRIQNALMVKKF